MIILGIETSCDETSAALLGVKQGNVKILSNVVSSQIKVHQKYGGVVPELAAREHLKNIIPVIKKALIQDFHVCHSRPDRESSLSTSYENKLDSRFRGNDMTNKTLGKRESPVIIKPEKIDYLAVTTGPGLVTSLFVGVEAAKTLAYAWQKPILAINHMEAHIYANWLNQDAKKIKFPALCLIASGGHTELVLIKGHGDYKKIGQTLDDAAGECFDKVAKMLNIGYPGGPIIEKFSKDGNPLAYDLPRPMIKSQDFNFSFAGLKTAVLYFLKKNFTKNQQLTISNQQLSNLCASFQQSIIDVLTEKTIKAAQKYKVKTILLAGGVAANQQLCKQFQEKVDHRLPNTQHLKPKTQFCTDNAAMVAVNGYFHVLKNNFTPFEKIKVNPQLEIK